jgi:TusA-related sulfurtransferase
MQYFPAMRWLALKHHRRLVTLAKAECPPGEVSVESVTAGREYSECDVWRQRALRRIESAGPTATVVMSGASDYTPLGADGEELSGEARAVALETGYLATLRRLHRAGLRSAVIKDLPAAEEDIPSCVSEELQDLETCSFRPVRDEGTEFDARAVARAPGTYLVDVTGEICPGDLCRAVIGNALVYRDNSHLSATFARTLTPWLEEGLMKAGVV